MNRTNIDRARHFAGNILIALGLLICAFLLGILYQLHTDRPHSTILPVQHTDGRVSGCMFTGEWHDDEWCRKNGAR